MTATITATDLAEAEEDRARARKYFTGWFAASLAATVVLNGMHPWLDAVHPRTFATVVFAAPPITAAAAAYGVELLWRCKSVPRAGAAGGRGTNAAIWVAVAATAALLTLAAVLSYASLSEMAACGPAAADRCTPGNLGAGLARLWPAVIDTGLVVSSTALYALRPMSGADRRALRRSTQAAAGTSPRPAASPAAPIAAAPAAPTAAPSDAAASAASAPFTAAAASLVHHDRAAAIAASGVTAKAVSDVARVLQLLDTGASDRRVHAETGIDARTVARIRKADSATAPTHLVAIH